MYIKKLPQTLQSDSKWSMKALNQAYFLNGLLIMFTYQLFPQIPQRSLKFQSRLWILLQSGLLLQCKFRTHHCKKTARVLEGENTVITNHAHLLLEKEGMYCHVQLDCVSNLPLYAMQKLRSNIVFVPKSCRMVSIDNSTETMFKRF